MMQAERFRLLQPDYENKSESVLLNDGLSDRHVDTSKYAVLVPQDVTNYWIYVSDSNCLNRFVLLSIGNTY